MHCIGVAKSATNLKPYCRRSLKSNLQASLSSIIPKNIWVWCKKFTLPWTFSEYWLQFLGYLEFHRDILFHEMTTLLALLSLQKKHFCGKFPERWLEGPGGRGSEKKLFLSSLFFESFVFYFMGGVLLKEHTLSSHGAWSLWACFGIHLSRPTPLNLRQVKQTQS